MSPEAQLAAVLQALCPRVYPDTAPVTTQRPYVTYAFIGGTSLRYLDNTAADKREAFVQINVWDSARLTASTLARSIEDALCAHPAITARPQGELTYTSDEDLGLRGTLQTFTVLFPR